MRNADFYRERGFSIIPAKKGSKHPLGEWKEFTERYATDTEVASWTRCNLALVMGRISGFVAIDADSREVARRLWKKLPRTNYITITPNGVHFIYPCDEEIRPAVKAVVMDEIVDIRAECSYAMAFPSIHPSGEQYKRWGNWDEAPDFDKSWIEKKIEHKPKTNIKCIDRYLEKIESIQGENGSAGLVRAASVCRDSGLSESEATIALIEWNGSPSVNPPWSHKEIARAITRIYANNKKAI